jgi:hypothetical protein
MRGVLMRGERACGCRVACPLEIRRQQPAVLICEAAIDSHLHAAITIAENVC